jgi:hypothetical protein
MSGVSPPLAPQAKKSAITFVNHPIVDRNPFALDGRSLAATNDLPEATNGCV